MSDEWLDRLRDAGLLAGAISALLGLCGLLWAKGVRPALDPIVSPFKRRRDARRAEQEERAKDREQLRQMHMQLHPNGGSSLADIARENHRNVAAIREDLERIADKVALQDQRSMLILRSLRYGWMRMTTSGECIEVSSAVEQLSGRTDADLLGMGWIGCIDPEPYERGQTHDKRCRSEFLAAVAERRGISMTFAFRRPDGTPAVVEFSSVPLYGRAGNLIGYHAFVERSEWSVWPPMKRPEHMQDDDGP